MNYKNFTILIIFALSLFAGAFTVSPLSAQAANLEVVFEAEPLFDEANFIPGDEVVRTVEVGNNSQSTQDIIVEAINAVDEDGLGDVLDLIIKEGATTLYEDTLGAFLRAGEVSLSSVGALASTTYSFGVTFDDGADNDAQATSIGFDLCVGFEGGETNCGDTVSSGEGEIIEEGGGGGSGGGGGGASSSGSGGGSITLIITDEEVINTDVNDGTATVNWNTNHLSTSQVIYGSESDPAFPFSIDLTASPYFGYPLGTVEDLNKTTSHSVELSGLSPGETYRFRVISRASPLTVSYEHSFAFAELALALDENNTGINNGINNGSDNTNIIFAGGIEGGGAGIPGPEDTAEEGSPRPAGLGLEKETAPQDAAAAFFGFPESFSDWLKYIIIVILIIIIIYIIWSRRKKKQL